MDLYGKTIDCHTHVGLFIKSLFDDKYPASGDVINLIERMDLYEVNYSVVFPFPDHYTKSDNSLYEKVMLLIGDIPYKLTNERMINEIEQLKITRLLPFFMFSINYAIEEQIEYMSKYAKSKKIFGLKYYPDSDMRRVDTLLTDGNKYIEFLLKYNLPLVIHCSEGASTNNNGYSNPLDMIQIAENNPELRMCIAHMGQFNKQLIDTIRIKKLNNVYIDTSPILHLCNVRQINGLKNCLNLDYNNPLEVIKSVYELLPNNIIWGTDYPFTYTCNLNNTKHNKDYLRFSYDEYYKFFYSIPNDIREMISSKNAIKFLFG